MRRQKSQEQPCSRVPDPKRQAAGRRSRNKGKEFERQIARDLRAIYDLPEVVEAIEAADNTQRKKAMAGSRVRRGEQGRNAYEPDVIAPCEWWFELQTTDGIEPERKLAQAKRDLLVYRGRIEDGPWRRPVAICHQKAARSIVACLEFRDLVEGSGGGFPLGCYPWAAMAVRIDYQDFLRILRSRR